jgi:hypothetical protein
MNTYIQGGRGRRSDLGGRRGRGAVVVKRGTSMRAREMVQWIRGWWPEGEGRT